ncbi:hypothetical protein ACRHGA_000052 [Yersinia enterocolitica]|nr:Uncharacterised protein [Yersinia frederiksenii]
MIYDTKLPSGMSLSKCPFCGGHAELYVDGEGIFAGCNTDGCLIHPITLTYATKRDAVRAWNFRGLANNSDPIVAVFGKLVGVKR